MCQCSSVSGAQQAALQFKISVAVAKKAQDAMKLQGDATSKLVEQIAQAGQSPGLGTQFDSAG